MQIQLSYLAEIEWDFDGDDVNWTWLSEHANFAHREACEFIVHIGDDEVIDGLSEYARRLIDDMREAHCTEDFIAAYEKVARAGFMRVLFWS